MKQKVLKILALVLVAVMLCCAAGCGSGNAGGEKKPGTGSGGESADSGSGWAEILAKMPESLRGTTITVYSWNDLTDVTDAPKEVAVVPSTTTRTARRHAIFLKIFFMSCLLY